MMCFFGVEPHHWANALILSAIIQKISTKPELLQQSRANYFYENIFKFNYLLNRENSC